MRNETLIVIAVLALGAGAAYYFLVYKKKTKMPIPNKIEPPKNDNNNVTPQNQTVKGSENIRALQVHLNSILPADYPKLVEDGIWGSKTQAALELMDKKADNGELTDPVKDKTKSIIDIAYDLSGISDLQDLGNGVVRTTKGIIQKKVDALKAGFVKIFG